MDINEMKLKDIKAIAAMFNPGEAETASRHVGKKCIIRTYASGVHFGTLVSQQGRKVELNNARRIWRFDVKTHGISLSEVAVFGPVDGRTKICETVDQIDLLDALEVIPATPAATEVIEKAETAKP